MLALLMQPRELSKNFHALADKLPRSRRGIGAMASRILDKGNQTGAITMTIIEYIVATILVGLISWAVLGLLMQEN
jgi:hypothetical protein